MIPIWSKNMSYFSDYDHLPRSFYHDLWISTPECRLQTLLKPPGIPWACWASTASISIARRQLKLEQIQVDLWPHRDPTPHVSAPQKGEGIRGAADVRKKDPGMKGEPKSPLVTKVHGQLGQLYKVYKFINSNLLVPCKILEV